MTGSAQLRIANLEEARKNFEECEGLHTSDFSGMLKVSSSRPPSDGNRVDLSLSPAQMNCCNSPEWHACSSAYLLSQAINLNLYILVLGFALVMISQKLVIGQLRLFHIFFRFETARLTVEILHRELLS